MRSQITDDEVVQAEIKRQIHLSEYVHRKHRFATVVAMVLIAIAAFVMALPVDCDACGCNGFLREGMSRIDVQARCGTPAMKDVVGETYVKTGPGRVVKSREEVWTYNFGPSCFTKEMYFRGGSLVGVKVGDYGY